MDLSSIPPMLFVVSGIVTITGINITNRLAIGFIKTRWGVIAANYCDRPRPQRTNGIANGLNPPPRSRSPSAS